MEKVRYLLAVPGDKIEIQSLLTQCQLPADDITDHLTNFVVARAEEIIIGVVGLEVCGEYGLLRSLAVVPKYRNHGVARILHSHIFSQARRNNLKELYLLTITASGYAIRLGFREINREKVPQPIQATLEFQTLCLRTSICMVLSLKNNP
jgi:N-acetylglutamate synthase-like GNAT family acetyltransferase